jgi:hypothetical protein
MAGEGYIRHAFWLADGEEEGRQTLKAAASQTWKRGDMLALDSNTTGAVALATAASTHLIGIAGDDRTSTTAGDLVPVLGTKPFTKFVGRANADPSSLDIGAQVDLVGATAAMMVNVGASSTDVFTFLSVLPVPGQDGDATYTPVVVVITETKHGLV